jgi:hypothetical protein
MPKGNDTTASLAREIRTTGDLRKMLGQLMVRVENGQIDPNTARVITGVAAQINNSFYAEAKVAIAQWQVQQVTPRLIGDLPLDVKDDKKTIEGKE